MNQSNTLPFFLSLRFFLSFFLSFLGATSLKRLLLLSRVPVEALGQAREPVARLGGLVDGGDLFASARGKVNVLRKMVTIKNKKKH